MFSMTTIFLWATVAAITSLFVFQVAIPAFADREKDPWQIGWDGALIGVAETYFFVFATCFGYPMVPLLWVGLKVGVQSNKWKTGSRMHLNVYLFMNLLSVAIGFVGAYLALGSPSAVDLHLHFRETGQALCDSL